MRESRPRPDRSLRTSRQVLCEFMAHAPGRLSKQKARISTQTLLACLELSQTPIVVLNKRGLAVLCNSSFRTFATRDASLTTISKRHHRSESSSRSHNLSCTDCCPEASAWLDSPPVHWARVNVSLQRIRIGREQLTAYSITAAESRDGDGMEQEFLHGLVNAAASVQMLIDLTEETASDQSCYEYLNQLQTSMHELLVKVEHETTLLNYSRLPASIREIFEMFISYYERLARVRGCQIEILKDPTASSQLRTADVLGIRIFDRVLEAAVRATGKGGVVRLGCQRTGAELELRVCFPGEVPSQISTKFFGASLIKTSPADGTRTMSSHTRYARKGVSMHFEENRGTTLNVRCSAVLEAPVPSGQYDADSVTKKKYG